jgi:hypothetical protein
MCAGFAGTARADAVDLLSFGNITWDLSQYPTASQPVPIQIQNLAVSSSAIFNGYDLTFTYVRTAGTGGIGLNTAVNPAAGMAAIASLYAPTVITAQSYVNSASSVSNPLQDYAVPNSKTDLVTVTFQPIGTLSATSVFEVYANNTTGATDYVDYTGTPHNFANCNSQFLFGTITVTAPEPSTLALLGVGAMLGVSGYLWRRRRSADQVGV